MDKLKTLLPFLVLIVVSAIFIIQFAPVAHPSGGIRLPLDVTAITELAGRTLTDLGIESGDMRVDSRLKQNRLLVRQVHREFGIEKGNNLLAAHIPGYFWDVRWMKKSPMSLLFGSGGDDSRKEAERAAKVLAGDVNLQFDVQGRLIGFERRTPDTLQVPSVNQTEAKELARMFLARHSKMENLSDDTVGRKSADVTVDYRMSVGGTSRATFESEKKVEQAHRTDYEFVWSTTSPELKNKIEFKIGIVGNAVSKFEIDYGVPEKYKNVDVLNYYQVALVLLYVIIVITMAVVAFKRLRAFELGFRIGVLVGIVVAIGLAFELYLVLYREGGWEIILPMIFGPLFYGGMLILVWAVSESVARETWKEKFISVDLISRGHVFHSRVGENTVKGIALGAACFGLWLALVWGADRIVPLWIGTTEDGGIRTFDAFSPALYVLTRSLYANFYTLAFFIMFILSYVRRRIVSPVVLVFVGSLFLGLLNHEQIQPLGIGIGIQILTGAVVVWTFYRFDVLAAYFALFSFSALRDALSLLGVGNPTYAQSGYVVVGLLCVLGAVGIATLFRKEEVVDFDSIVPAFARHISERQRLQQELEIARQVQMSFLPKANPKTYQLDIASRCAPALEVGGDYYDFIDVGEKRLGVAVGDVSGKGTQAAFFMTLTKGFLRALAGVSLSPAAVLTRVNKLFYENVERGVFISMVYGIFDTEQHVLTFARAGHNPLIMRKEQAKQVQVVNPMGLALGLDQGETFGKSIQEVKVQFQPGDLFVFYTDGFPEAMNKTLELFGEDRLCKTIERHADGSAAEIMEGIFSEMKLFTGKAKQHDDMTIVVVKVV